MEVAYKQQREVIEGEQAEQQERSGMLARGEPRVCTPHDVIPGCCGASY